MNELTVFENAEFGKIRTMTINNEPWFVGKDVAEALGYADPNKVVAMHVDVEDKLNDKTASSLGQRGGWFINESGLYSLIFASKLPEAKEFKHWVTSEVLPSIRKHGAYMTENTLEAALCNPDYLIELALRLKGETSRRQEAEAMNEQLMIRNKMLEDQAAENQYKVYFAECVMKSKKTITIGEMAKILKQNGVPNMGRNRFYEWLREEGFLIRQKGNDYNTPTQKSMELGLFRIQETPFHTFGGCYGVNKTTKVTPYGQLYFTNLFMKMQLSAPEQCAC